MVHGMKSKEQQFAIIVEQLIDGAKESKLDTDAIRARCYTKKYGYVQFVVEIPESKVIAHA